MKTEFTITEKSTRIKLLPESEHDLSAIKLLNRVNSESHRVRFENGSSLTIIVDFTGPVRAGGAVSESVRE